MPIAVIPSFLNSAPLVIPVILKFVTSAPSAAFFVITKPVVVCVSSSVVAGVTDGVLAIVAASVQSENEDTPFSVAK